MRHPTHSPGRSPRKYASSTTRSQWAIPNETNERHQSEQKIPLSHQVIRRLSGNHIVHGAERRAETTRISIRLSELSAGSAATPTMPAQVSSGGRGEVTMRVQRKAGFPFRSMTTGNRYRESPGRAQPADVTTPGALSLRIPTATPPPCVMIDQADGLSATSQRIS